MSLVVRDPITTNGPSESNRPRLAQSVCHALLAVDPITDLPAHQLPFLAAAAAELALCTGIRWSFSQDDPPVALLRMVAKAAIIDPDAGGPHCRRLLDELTATAAAERGGEHPG